MRILGLVSDNAFVLSPVSKALVATTESLECFVFDNVKYQSEKRSENALSSVNNNAMIELLSTIISLMTYGCINAASLIYIYNTYLILTHEDKENVVI